MARTHRSTRQAFWQSHLGKAQAQGLSLRAYARREGLSEHSLYAARHQARAQASAVAQPTPAPAFAAIRVAAGSCELSLPGGLVLRLPEPPPASWLAALLREMAR